MKILIAKAYEGERRITVLPRHEARMAPIQLRGSDEAVVREELLVVLSAVGDREGAPARAAL